MRNLRIVPFNLQHATLAGKFAKILFDAKKTGEIVVNQRNVIPNDVKIFAQANCIEDIKYFVTSDTEAAGLINRIAENNAVTFDHMSIILPHTNQFGILDLPEK